MIDTPSSAAADADRWRARDAAVISSCYSRYSDLVVDRASGARLHTVDGREVLDFGSGIGVVNLGHNHPDVVAAVRAQLDSLWHTSVTMLNPATIAAAEAIADIAPAGLDRVFLCNSGAESVEAALKLARKSTGRSDVIAFAGAFHGRTYGAISLTASKQNYRAGIGPLLGGIHHVDYPYAFRWGVSAEEASALAMQRIDRLLATRLDPRDVAAIVIEPVLGEGGYVVPPADFLGALRRLCDSHGILLVADEVQSGFGRTGRMLAVEHSGVVPDILCLAKGIGNGLPAAAMVARAEVMSAWSPGDHGTTFGGNPVACAAVSAVCAVMARDRIPERAEQLGRRAMPRLDAWSERFAGVADVRGLGLMIGVEVCTASGAPDPDSVERVRAAALRRGVLLLSCGTDDNVIRLIPPLTIPEADLDSGLDIVEACLAEVLG